MNDFIAAIGDIYSDRVTYRHCERFHQYCVDKGLRPSSVNSHISLVKRIFSLAVKRGQFLSLLFVRLLLLHRLPTATQCFIESNSVLANITFAEDKLLLKLKQ